MKRTRDRHGCFLDGRKRPIRTRSFRAHGRSRPRHPPGGSCFGCRLPGAVSARAVLIGTQRVLRDDYPFEWRPVRTAAGHPSVAGPDLETGLPSGHRAPRLARAQVKALVATGLTARPAQVDRPGGESRPAPGTLAVWSGSSGVPAPGAGRSACPHSTGSPRPKDDDDVAEDGAHLWES